jgi:hypothetical protein
MAISTFSPASPDSFIVKDTDMSLVKFGHLNAVVNELNTKATIVTTSTVTQTTNRATPVTLNANAGVITTNSTNIAIAGNAVFTVNNSYVKADSVILLTIDTTGLAAYSIHLAVESVAAGSFAIRIYNATGATLAGIKINFVVI